MRRRVNLAQFMAMVAFLAVGLAAMKVATEWLARGVVLTVFVGLLVVALGAIVRRQNRAAWIGVAVFGWGYDLLVLGQSFVNATFVSGNQTDPSDVWRVDGLAGAIADRLHPEPPYPADPFPNPNMHINLNAAPGLHTKKIDGVVVPFTPEEYKLQADYEARSAFYEHRVEAAHSARVIGLAIQGAAFALIGGAAGHALSDRSTTAGASIGTDPSPLPG